MSRYRKRPVVIDAVQWDGHLRTAVDFITGDFSTDNQGSLFIATLEGEMRADVGDWIIRGIKGEYYPCKPDIFAATYEPADAA